MIAPTKSQFGTFDIQCTPRPCSKSPGALQHCRRFDRMPADPRADDRISAPATSRSGLLSPEIPGLRATFTGGAAARRHTARSERSSRRKPRRPCCRRRLTYRALPPKSRADNPPICRGVPRFPTGPRNTTTCPRSCRRMNCPRPETLSSAPVGTRRFVRRFHRRALRPTPCIPTTIATSSRTAHFPEP